MSKIHSSPVLKLVALNGFTMPRVTIHSRQHYFPTNETSLVHTMWLRTGLEHGIAVYTVLNTALLYTQLAPLDNSVTDNLVKARVQLSPEAIFLRKLRSNDLETHSTYYPTASDVTQR